MSVINTNMSSIIATNAIIANDRDQQQAMERLSTGLRINAAGDDAAGLAISERMKAEVSGLTMAARNANDAISMLETVEGATREIHMAFQRMRELAVQASTDTYSHTDRAALDLEFQQLYNEIVRIATQTTWNNMTLMNGANDAANATVTTTPLTIQLGKNAGQTMALTIKSFDPRTAIRNQLNLETINPGTGATILAGNVAGATPAVPLGGTNVASIATALGEDLSGNDEHIAARVAANGWDVRKNEDQAFGSAVLWSGEAGVATAAQSINILTRGNGAYTLIQMDKAITALSAERAKIGAFMHRLEYAGDNLTNVARHQEQSRSRIADADYATETTELSRTTIIAQASTAMLAQANAAKQTVLTLLQ